jgi:tight adherence protein B
VTMVIPIFVLRHRRDQRVLQFEEQFPEAIDLIARALRAGHAFTTGLSMVAEEVGAPVGLEFRLLYERQNFGMPLPEALREFARRIPLLDAKFFATAVLTQRESGGNLAEVLDNLSSVIRERFRVKRQVRVISAHGRLTGWVLSLMPPGLAVAFMMVRPGHLDKLLNDTLGVQMIVGAVTLQLIGTMAIRRIVKIEY